VTATPSIESSPYPLAFRVDPHVPLPFDGLAAPASCCRRAACSGGVKA